MQTANNNMKIDYEIEENNDIEAIRRRFEKYYKMCKDMEKKADEIKNGGTKA